MRLSLTLKNTIAFLALLFVRHELHELIHIVVGYFLCGCWEKGILWVGRFCQACSPAVNTMWISLAGPLLSYGLMWVGYFLMAAKRPIRQQVIGVALLFANQPFVRILPVLDREGDESVVTRDIIDMNSMTIMSWSTEIVLVLLLTIPVLIRAWRLLHPELKLFVFASFLAVPLLAESVLMNQFANGLLQAGLLSGNGLLGSPELVNVWNGCWLLVLLSMFRHIPTLLSPTERSFHLPKRHLFKERF